ncbi:DUF4390 domain-containing protein [Desulfurispira natronophila]|uniref:DUF4390 domain-containing protein n=1 Tax=Desulfurispira natronophila TaxID=682562 RepID=A0A7W7Y3G2_9BACT|nr:DUF4390 domain-containing protein [Desulfurispira natronophila]MBB5021323.1 hypothetical protein [Desulfurispira natronophila]
MRFLFVFGLLFLAFTHAAANQRTLQLEAFRIEDQVAYVQLRVDNLYTQDIIDAIDGGLDVQYSYEFNLQRHRLLWFDATKATFKVYKQITYDALRRVYHVQTIKGEQHDVREYRNRERALDNFQNSTLIPIPGFQSHHYLQVRASLSEFSHWFPLNLIVRTFADWEFRTEPLTLEYGDRRSE